MDEINNMLYLSPKKPQDVVSKARRQEKHGGFPLLRRGACSPVPAAGLYAGAERMVRLVLYR
jgi:hypothetical protein